jgi:hypothetical protein
LCGTGSLCPPGFECASDGKCRLGPLDLGTARDAAATDGPPMCLACTGGGCCSNEQCLPSGTSTGVLGKLCSDGTVVDCGTPGQPCCGEHTCGGQACCSNEICVSRLGTCANGMRCMGIRSCGGCGAAGQPCCPIVPDGVAAPSCTVTGLTCAVATMTCVSCGGAGQPCCDGSRCANGGCCDHATPGGVCVAQSASCSNGGSCVARGCANGTCGRLREPSCSDGIGCTAPLSIEHDGVCTPCGGSGEPCCETVGGKYCSPPFVCNAANSCQH